MNTAGLSLSDAPPFAKIYPFFLASAFFGFLSFAALSFADSANRYDTYLIGAVHLFTIGFLLNAVFAALFQMLPVVGGIKIEASKLTLSATAVLSIGAILFFMHFYMAAMLFLLFAVGVLLFTLLKKLFTQKPSDTASSIRLALVGGVLALSYGLHLISSYALSRISASHMEFANTHILLSAFGFLGALIIAVARQVLPMFYVAPEFPRFCRMWSYVILAASILLTIPPLALFGKITLWIAFLAFGTVALKKLYERKRKISDASLKLWQTGLLSLLLGLILIAYDYFFELPQKELLFGVFFGLGFLASIVKAMLNKIVPFLAWFHLTSVGIWDAPSVREIITDKTANTELYLHLAAMFLFCISFVLPQLFIAGAIFSAASFGVLFYSICRAILIYKNALKLSTKNS